MPSYRQPIKKGDKIMAYIREDGFGGYRDDSGNSYRPDGFGGYRDGSGNSYRPDGFGGYTKS